MPDAPAQIRFAGPEDAATIHAMIVELAVYEKEPDAVKATVEGLRAQLEQEHPPFQCLLAEEGEACVGIALFFHNYSTWTGKWGLYLEDLFVSPSARGRGIGRALLGSLAGIALERDCGRMEWAVLDWNQPAIDFYEQLGARELKEWKIFRLTGESLQAVSEGYPSPTR